MTTEIEKQFFEAFRIEPKLNRPCEQLLQNKYCNENSGSRDTYFDPYPYCVGFENCVKDYKARDWVYPKITDRILLELILIYSRISNLPICYDTVERFKEATLECFIEDSEDFKHQVQALFEENNNDR